MRRARRKIARVWFSKIKCCIFGVKISNKAMEIDGKFIESAEDNCAKANIPVKNVDNKSFASDEYQSLRRSNMNPSVEAALRNGHVSILTDHLILTSAVFVNSGIIDAAHVTCVISAAPELPLVPLSEQVTMFRRVNVMDCPNFDISQYFDEVADLIEQVASSGGRTLIHCLAGISRSATFCLAYLMKHQHLTLLQAYECVKTRRPRIKPNCGFFKQLIQYEKSLFVNSTVHMVFNEVLQMSVPDVYDSQYKMLMRKPKKKRGSNQTCKYAKLFETPQINFLRTELEHTL